ncbi:MAG: hypothetical protein ACYSUF_09540 [Planctomycetota bacterium]
MSRIGAIVVREIRTILPALIFFLLMFHLIAFTRAVILSDFSLASLRATVATVGALIVAKSILVVEKLPIVRVFSGKLVLNALWRALLFGVVALLFRFFEELIPMILKHESLATATAQLSEEVPWRQFWVLQVWLFGFLFLYCLGIELVRVAGANKATAMLWGPTVNAPERS